MWFAKKDCSSHFSFSATQKSQLFRTLGALVLSYQWCFRATPALAREPQTSTPDDVTGVTPQSTLGITARNLFMMMSRCNRTLLSLSICLAAWVLHASAAAVKGETGVAIGNLSNAQIEEQLQVCSW
jgi:hypothetical protein